MTLPPVVSKKEWESAIQRLRTAEKQATRARDALAAERRRLPMVHIAKDYVFEGPNGPARLVDLFEGRRQLILYHFMMGPNQTVGCDGCSMVVDQIGHLAHLHARDTSFVLVARAPIAQIEAYRQRMGWTIPWFSSFGSAFNHDFGVGPESPRLDEYQDGESFGLSVFLRDGEDVYRTYFTSGRGVETLGSAWTLLDLTPFGRQETWEDSPEGWPQTAPYEWWRRHDEYESAGGAAAQSADANIRATIERLRQAIYDRDVDAATVCYAPDIRVFDLAPPLQKTGRDAVGRALRDWLRTWDGTIALEFRDLRVSVGENAAYATALSRLRGRKTDGAEPDLWFRTTYGLRRQLGAWLIAHEHTSTPFYMDGSFKAAVDLEPQ